MLNLRIDLINNKNDQFKLFLYSFIVWSGLFFIVNQLKMKNLTKKIQDDTKNRIISILHGMFTFWTSTIIIFYEQPLFSDANSQAMQFTMIVSAAYFAYDFIACMYYDLADTALVAHHSLAICGYAVATFSKFGAPCSIYGLMCAEVSNFPMHARCILRNMGLKHTKLYELCEWTYFCLYIVFRGYFVPWMVYQSVPEPQVPLLVKLAAIGIFLQSVYFIFEMKKIIKRLYSQYKERSTKQIHHHWFTVNPRIFELTYTQRERKDKVF